MILENYLTSNIIIKYDIFNIIEISSIMFRNNGNYYIIINKLLSEKEKDIIIEESLNNFLSDTTFPYSPSSSSNGGPSGEGIHQIKYQIEN